MRGVWLRRCEAVNAGGGKIEGAETAGSGVAEDEAKANGAGRNLEGDAEDDRLWGGAGLIGFGLKGFKLFDLIGEGRALGRV
jgi:hypothetical protein